MKRREFIGTLAGSAAMLTAVPTAHPEDAGGALPKRPLGTTGLSLSVIGFSGLVARDSSPEAADRIVGESLEKGVNFFDAAASYGNSEEMLAPILRPHRKDIILSSKTRERTREGAERDFSRSCEIYGTDYFDLYLVHGIQDVARDVDAAFSSGGVMEWALEKRQAGGIRFLGFSAHSTEAALAALDRHPFDFFYFPISYVPYLKADFGPAVLAKASEKSVPCVSLKSLARQRWPEGSSKSDRCAKCWYQPIEDAVEASLAIRWALSQQVVSILPPGEEQYYRMALTLSGNLSPITPEETERLRTLAADMLPLFPRG